ncbi:MAG TPA: hypothetical protein VMW63_00330 [Methanoregulaceae archaeon]|nr:hypothetical protein [Methanoregulaceae archaeon]
MKAALHATLSVCIALALLFTPAFAASAESEAAAAQVTVTNVTLDPQVFIEGDTGIITVEIANNGLQGVGIRRATLYDEDIRLLSNPYDTATSIGGGNRQKFIFTVLADVPEGIYYPTFSVDFRDAGYLRYPVKLQVQNDPLEISLLDKPDAFSAGVKDEVEILVGNPRDNPVNGVIIYLRGQGIDVIPSSSFIGNLNPDSSRKVTFSVTPEESTTLSIIVDYKNGINSHTETKEVPLTLGESKKKANPILSNIVVSYEGGVYSVTGDVTNAGLEVANSVVITAGEGADPQDPYKQYVVGALQPDDFSSFEITFSAEDVTSIPVLASYKDSDGNQFTSSTSVDVPEANTSNQKEPGIPIPVIAMIIILVVAIGGIIWYSWRKRNE